MYNYFQYMTTQLKRCIYQKCDHVVYIVLVFLGQSPRPVMGCRLTAALSQPRQLTWVGYRCISDHEHHTQYKEESLLSVWSLMCGLLLEPLASPRPSSLSSFCSWGLHTCLLQLLHFCWAKHNYIYSILTMVSVWLFH